MRRIDHLSRNIVELALVRGIGSNRSASVVDDRDPTCVGVIIFHIAA